MNIALVGKLGSGKTTAAGILVASGATRHSWAQPVRDIFSMAYDTITPENYAEVKQRVYTVMEAGYAQVDGFTRMVPRPVERTGRELLQQIGTEAMRACVDQDFWIKAGLRRLEGVQEPIVNDDTRFLNEAAALRERGFKIVRITRPGGPTGSPHASELEQDGIEVDATVANDGTVDDLREALANLIHTFMMDQTFTRLGAGLISQQQAIVHALDPGRIMHQGTIITAEEWGAGDGPTYSHGRPFYYECNVPACTLGGHHR